MKNPVPKGKLKHRVRQWLIEECPACKSKDLSTNYFTGEVFCLRCGLVIC